MVVPSPILLCNSRTKMVTGIPVINLSDQKPNLLKTIVRACEEYGMFKLVNHGVSMEMIMRLESESLEFFSRPAWEKQRAGPATPFGYGCKNIGSNGDMGELEYLLLHTHPNSVSKYSGAVNDYVGAMREVARLLFVPTCSCYSYPDYAYAMRSRSKKFISFKK